MVKISEILQYLETLAPLDLQTDFDNSGLLLGDPDREISSLLLALDVTDRVIKEAADKHCGLIVSHHPLIFHPIKNLTLRPETRKIFELIKNDISVISFHTNLDIADGGVNDVLLSKLGAVRIDSLDHQCCGRIGEYREEIDFSSFLALCFQTLQEKGLRYYYAGKPVKRIAVMGGAGSAAIMDAFRKDCDTYVTSDIKYHDFLLAEELKINLIDADHFCTENPVMFLLESVLSARFPELSVIFSQDHSGIIDFYVSSDS